MGLPERDYYLRTDADSRKLRSVYRAHVAKMLQLGGDVAAAANAQAILGLETQFAPPARYAAVSGAKPPRPICQIW